MIERDWDGLVLSTENSYKILGGEQQIVCISFNAIQLYLG